MTGEYIVGGNIAYTQNSLLCRQVTRVKISAWNQKDEFQRKAWHSNSDNQEVTHQDIPLRLVVVVCIGLTYRGMTLVGFVSLWSWTGSACLLCSVRSFSYVGNWTFGRTVMFFFLFLSVISLPRNYHGWLTNNIELDSGHTMETGQTMDVWDARTMKINIYFFISLIVRPCYSIANYPRREEEEPLYIHPLL